MRYQKISLNNYKEYCGLYPILNDGVINKKDLNSQIESCNNWIPEFDYLEDKALWYGKLFYFSDGKSFWVVPIERNEKILSNVNE